MYTRTDFISQTYNQPDLFSDFLDDFTAHPVTGDIVRIKNENSIKQSVKNLVLTSLGERPFQPFIGSNIYKSLFEPNDFILVDSIKFNIQNTLHNNEPRVSLVDVSVLPDADSHSISVNIVFIILNTQNVQSLNLILKRVR